MNFQFLIVLTLACASSAYQYNYYARPLSATHGEKEIPIVGMPEPSNELVPEPLSELALEPLPEITEEKKQEVLSEETEEIKERSSYMQRPMGRMLAEENPCTEELLRSPEIQAFKDPLSRNSYIVCTGIFVFTRMTCATGTVFDEVIRHCVPEGWEQPVCPTGLCQNQADCIIDEHINEYKCLCRVGFTGLKCEINIDECALGGNQVCQNKGGVCVDQLNAYYCDFGMTIGIDTEETIDKPCTLVDLSLEKQFFEIPSIAENVFLQCTGESKWEVRRCADQLFWDQSLKTCTLDRPVKKTGVCLTYPCQNGGECLDLGNYNFQCTCKQGFTGAICEEKIDNCLMNPCQNGGRCVSHLTGYNCVCQDKLVDSSCATGLRNPCTGPFEYLPNELDATKYFVCGLDGFAFSKSCAKGLVWSSNENSCVLGLQKTLQRMSIYDAPVSSTYKTIQPQTGYKTVLPQTIQPQTGYKTVLPQTSQPQTGYKTVLPQTSQPQTSYKTVLPQTTAPSVISMTRPQSSMQMIRPQSSMQMTRPQSRLTTSNY